MACDPVRTLAWGTDASFYRLVPKVVVKARTEDEVVMATIEKGQHLADLKAQARQT